PPTAQTMWETTFTLQYKPVPPFIIRGEFRYDKSDANTFQFGTRAANNQQTLAAEVIYLF
ncbi:MAG: outer membrane beta-barrel protein, partial [Nitrospiraceae bacterium]